MGILNIIIFLIFIINCQTVFSIGSENTHNQPRIVIVGAGAAGIAAASKLFENGFKNITIIEAENRIGGRVYTTQFGGQLVDLGAQWIHGEVGNVAFELASSFNILSNNDTSNTFDELAVLDSSGNFVNNTVVHSLLDFFDKYVDQHVARDNVESIGEFVEKMFVMEFKNESEIFNNNIRYLHFLELFATSSDPADSWNQLSAAGLKEYEIFPGNHLINWKTRGYSTILDILTKRYPDSSKEIPVIENTILNTEVQSINYSGNSRKSLVSIVTEGGQVHLADHVIITVSLGVLKEKHGSLFNPPLPRKKVEAIESIGFGNAGKIYLHFEKPFSHDEIEKLKIVGFVWNDAHRVLIENTEKAWLLGILTVSVVEYKFNILELWISAKYVKKMEEMAEQKVFEHTVEFLHQFMGKNFNIPQPVGMIRTQWFNNPHFRGTYSYRSVEAHRKNVYPNILEEPLSLTNLDILFAGEATSQHRFSTVDGAIISGWKASDRLINFYKN